MWARLRRPWHPAACFVAWVAYVVTIERSGPSSLLSLAAAMVMFFVVAMRNNKEFAVLDAGASLLLLRRTAFTEEICPTEVTSDQIEYIRPRHSNQLIRFVRPEVWQVGAQRFVIDSKRLSAVLQRLTGTSAI